jgi:hypothetical protein
MSYGIAGLAVSLTLIAALTSCNEPVAKGDLVAKDELPARRWFLRPAGVSVLDGRTGKRVAEVALPDWQWAGEPYSCGPAIAVGPGGEVLVTSDVVPTLWRIDPVSLAVTTHQPVLDADSDKDVGFTGLVYSRTHNAYFGVSYDGSLWRIDPLLRRAQKVALDAPVAGACHITLRRPEGRRPSGLCVLGSEGMLTVELAPDQRSGAVRLRLPCVPPAAEAASGSDRSRAP